MKTNDENDYTVPALARGLKILEIFNQQQRVLSTHDFAEHLAVSKSAIYRIVQTLTEMQYLKKVARNTYELGPAVVSLGYSFLASRDISDVSAPHMNQLRDETSVSCHLAILDGRDTLYIYRALASQRLSVNVPVGTRLPSHSNAMGRILLSGLSDDTLGQLYLGAQLDGVPKPNPQSLPELRRRIKEEKAQGYAISQSDFATAIATPIRNYANEVVAAINLSGPDVFMQGEGILAEITTQLQNTSMAISKELGYRGW
ncbi:IclR family transcriptional regulator [Pseudomaricurvus alkylphenolicus]|uniref:IclR family transcriptional regulator n=1 Tax=Pseudomaricurvus alkylphenolicus TaxID=1306991 RepID=UPI00141DB6BB|nr:IclR family transcriptional regulator [Pseudomaricurvus alkylphenolicus]NIB42501.1 IclR family transcriptional regulator [Pseudomaricurvus alkylphenolicus]